MWVSVSFYFPFEKWLSTPSRFFFCQFLTTAHLEFFEGRKKPNIIPPGNSPNNGAILRLKKLFYLIFLFVLLPIWCLYIVIIFILIWKCGSLKWNEASSCNKSGNLFMKTFFNRPQKLGNNQRTKPVTEQFTLVICLWGHLSVRDAIWDALDSNLSCFGFGDPWALWSFLCFFFSCQQKLSGGGSINLLLPA